MSLWNSLLLTTLGGLLAIAGTSLGAWWQQRMSRETRREQYRREDTYRLQNERREAYASYISEIGRARPILRHLGSGTSREEGMAARNEVFHAFIHVRLIGGHDVVVAGGQLFREVNRIAYGKAQLEEERYGSLVEAVMDAARRDLLRDSDREDAAPAVSRDAP